MPEEIVPHSFYQRPTRQVAKMLLGKVLSFTTDCGEVSGKIIEMEAYISDGDLANHASVGETKRNSVMFQSPGRLYIYRIYGKRYCLNIVTGPIGVGEAVLIRAVEPITGIPYLARRRGVQHINQLCNGPAKLTQAFGINRDYNGMVLSNDSPIRIKEQGEMVTDQEIVTTQRIGITKSRELQLRFYIK